MVGPVRRLIVVAALFALAACASFQPDDSGTTRTPAENEIDPIFLEKKKTVQVRGRFAGASFVAERIELRKDDKEVTLKGVLAATVQDDRVEIGGAEFRIVDDTKLEAADGSALSREAFAEGAWVKAEAVWRDEELKLRKLTLRERKPDEVEELAGPIVDADPRKRTVTIGDIDVAWTPDTPVVWNVKGVEMPAEFRRGPDKPRAKELGLLRVRRLDPEDTRPAEQWSPVDGLRIGGELSYENEWRNNHDLQDWQDRDRLIHDLGLQLEVSAMLDRHFYLFGKLQGGLAFVHFDEERDLEEPHTLKVGELFALAEDWPLPGFSLQVGRQDFDDGREWLFDEQMDGIRAWFNFDLAVIELSVSEILFEPSPENDDVTNFLAGVHLDGLLPDHKIFVWALHRQGGTQLDLDRTHLGISAEGELGDFQWWGDAGWTFGQEDDLDLDGVGADAMAMYVFDELPLEPSLVAGIAYGSGDRDPFDGEDTRFRQSGLNDNQDRFNGVFSFRYLGELVRPDLQNLIVLTGGLGLRLADRVSLDLVLHHYRQEYALGVLGPSRLRLSPTGESKDLGYEFDVVFGVDTFFPLRFQVVLGYFQPGPAFLTDDDAWFGTFEVKYTF